MTFGLVVLAATAIHIKRGYAKLPARPPEFEIIAHAGVHQNYPSGNLTNETCTASRIYPLTHRFIDNTIPAIGEAFKEGATMVEMDIHHRGPVFERFANGRNRIVNETVC